MNDLTKAVGQALDNLPRNPSLTTIQAFERQLKTMPNQIELEVRHYFADGAYLRKLLVPAGTILTGKLHKTQHFMVITKGLIECKTDAGMSLLKAGDIVLTQPGTKRVLIAFEDSVMITFHVTPETDLAKLEAAIIESEVDLIEGVAP